MADPAGGRQTPPEFAEARAHARTGRSGEAADRYRACIARHPGFLPAYVELAQLRAHDDPAGARRLLMTALTLAHDAPAARSAIARMLAALIAPLSPDIYDADLEAQLVACLDDPALDPQPLAQTAAELLLLKYPVVDAEAAAHDPLWHAFLARCRNTLPAMEPRIAALRRHVLTHDDSRLDPLAAALALECFASGYVLPVTPEEIELLNEYSRASGNPGVRTARSETLDSRLRGVDGGASASATLRRAMVAPLIDLDTPPPPLTSPLVAALVKRTLTDLAEERALAAALPSVGATSRSASQHVRAQYESHPYPRWQTPPTPRPADLRALIERLPGINHAALPPAPLATLIAGCGTGYEAIDLARTDPSLAITAIDLSRASLAFAQRNAAELGLGAIAFVQGDLLDLGAERFDLITATGVLHHLADPLEGLRTLTAVLAPGGVMRIALYSRRARALVREAHALITARGWQGDDGIRALRAHILALAPEAPLARLTESDDFWSLSGCRDLLFHVLEHQFDVPEITRMIDTAGLKWIGIDASPEAQHLFRARFGDTSPLDPQKWDSLEADHPALFAGMVPLWCQKPVSP
ncbi:methyltransferase family protein [Hephaestia caeni]|uniref:Methyltransferase family protein n=1 Tax=Hephaestia caeni TaxID=645617 RepID=A0A397NNF6_9SPHN|nr:class I SAM-dependent methyltransferase [Hephaestia caeni]RIA37133.1 methyltransferase family protein [Hephaestia caeni]